MAGEPSLWDTIKSWLGVTTDPGGSPQASLSSGYFADNPQGAPTSAASWKASSDSSYEVDPFSGPLSTSKGAAANVEANMPNNVFSYETPLWDASTMMGFDAPTITETGNLSSGMDAEQKTIDQTAGQGSAYQTQENPSAKTSPSTPRTFNKYSLPRSQQEAWYQYADTHDVPEEYKGDLGYVNLLRSKDSDTIAQWALDDPMMMMRLLNSGIDISDTDNLSQNISDYMWGDNVISLYDYMMSEGGYDLGDDFGMIDELGRYLTGDAYNYGFDEAFAKEHNLTNEDVIGQMLARQLSNYGMRRGNRTQLNEYLPENVLNGGEIRFIPYPEEGLGEDTDLNAAVYGNILDNDYIPEEVANAVVASMNKSRSEDYPYVWSYKGKKDTK